METKLLGNDAIAAAIKSGNINISTNSNVEIMDLNAESKAAQLKHAETLQKYETQRRARALVVPTSIEEIKSRLRDLRQPVTLFGEDHADRRERLREVIARLELGDEDLAKMKSFLNQGSQSQSSTLEVKSNTANSTQSNEKLSKASLKEIVYTKASEELINARKTIADYSFSRAHDRILKTKHLRENEELQAEDDRFAYELYSHNSALTLNSSQIGDDRPLTSVRYRPCGRLAASASLGCGVKVWDLSSLSCIALLRGHTERVTSVAWPPQESLDLLASSSSDGSCNIWKLSLRGGEGAGEGGGLEEEGESEDEEMQLPKKISSTKGEELKRQRREEEEREGEGDQDNDSEESMSETGSDMAMEEEEARIHKHPHTFSNESPTTFNDSSHPSSSSSISSQSLSYRLSLQLNGGGGVVGDCSFHPMGGLVATAHADYTWRLWDIHTGSELLFQDGGHCRECCSIAFHPDGGLLMTGDAGGVLQLWDLRSGQNIHGFQGHMKKISSIDFNANGFQVVSSGVDNLARIWDLRKKKPFYVLPAHSLSISDVRYSKSGELLLSSSFDGSVKVWGTRDYRLLRTLLGHTGKVMSADFSPIDEKRILSAGFDRTIKYWTHMSEL